MTPDPTDQCNATTSQAIRDLSWEWGQGNFWERLSALCIAKRSFHCPHSFAITCQGDELDFTDMSISSAEPLPQIRSIRHAHRVIRSVESQRAAHRPRRLRRSVEQRFVVAITRGVCGGRPGDFIWSLVFGIWCFVLSTLAQSPPADKSFRWW